MSDRTLKAVKRCVIGSCPPDQRDNVRFGDMSSRRDAWMLPVCDATMIDVGRLSAELRRLGCTKVWMRAGSGSSISRLEIYIPKPVPYDGCVRALSCTLATTAVAAGVALAFGM